MMDKAPERILATVGYVGPSVTTGEFATSMAYVSGHPTEYIRADLASPLGADAMREAAAQYHDETATILDRDDTHNGGNVNGASALAKRHRTDAAFIRALPTPDDAAMLAAALKLPEVAAMREAAKDVMDWRYGPTIKPDSTCFERMRAALAALEGKP